MRRPQVRTAIALTALLLIGLTGSALSLLNQTSGALDEDQTRFPTSGRSTSAEIFLTGGGSSSTTNLLAPSQHQGWDTTLAVR